MDRYIKNHMPDEKHTVITNLLSVFNKIKDQKLAASNSRQKNKNENTSLNDLFSLFRYIGPELSLYSHIFKDEFNSSSQSVKQANKGLNDPNIIENVKYTIEDK